MAVLLLSSTNPNFSHIIRKNPNSLPFLRNIRKGKMLGWFSDEQSYALWFKDGDDEISFKDHEGQDFEHISPNKYQAALAYSSILKEAFDTAMRTPLESDTSGFTHSIEFNILLCKNPGYFDIFERHHEHLTIERTNIVAKSWKVKLTSTSSLYEFLNMVSLFLIFIAVINDEYIFFDDTMFARYAESIKKLDSPYFLRYIFKSRIMENRKIFEKYKEILEASEKNTYQLKFGGTQLARREFVADQAHMKYDIIDIGCGDGSHLIPLAKRSKDLGILIHAIDRDPEVLEIARKKCAARELDHVRFYASISEFLESVDDTRNHQVILSEVIEHNEMSELFPLLSEIQKIPRTHKIIITTPNKDFNVHYAMSEIFRHDDHKWEMTASEFENAMKLAFTGNYTLKFVNVGDNVNGESPTSGCIIQPVDIIPDESSEPQLEEAAA